MDPADMEKLMRIYAERGIPEIPTINLGLSPSMLDDVMDLPRTTIYCKSCKRPFKTQDGLKNHTKNKH